MDSNLNLHKGLIDQAVDCDIVRPQLTTAIVQEQDTLRPY